MVEYSSRLLCMCCRSSEAARMGALSALEAKYCKQPARAPKGQQNRDAEVSEPTDEEFAAAAGRLKGRTQEAGKSNKKKAKKGKT